METEDMETGESAQEADSENFSDVAYDEPVYADEMIGADRNGETENDNESDAADEGAESADFGEADDRYSDSDSEIEDGDGGDLPKDADLKELLMQMLSKDMGDPEDAELMATSGESEEDGELLEILNAQHESQTAGLGIITFGIGFAVGLLLIRLLFGGLIGGSDRSV